MIIELHKCGLPEFDQKLQDLTEIFQNEIDAIEQATRDFKQLLDTQLPIIEAFNDELDKVLKQSSIPELQTRERLAEKFNLNEDTLNANGLAIMDGKLMQVTSTEGNFAKARMLYEDLNRDVHLTSKLLSDANTPIVPGSVSPNPDLIEEGTPRNFIVIYSKIKRSIFTPRSDKPRPLAEIEEELNVSLNPANVVYVNPTLTPEFSSQILTSAAFPQNTIIIFTKEFVSANVNREEAAQQAGLPQEQLLVSIYKFEDEEAFERGLNEDVLTREKFSEVASQAAAKFDRSDKTDKVETIAEEITRAAEIKKPSEERFKKGEDFSLVKKDVPDATNVVTPSDKTELDIQIKLDRSLKQLLILKGFNVPSEQLALLNDTTPLQTQKAKIRTGLTQIQNSVSENKTENLEDFIGSILSKVAFKVVTFTDRNILTRLKNRCGVSLSAIKIKLDENIITDIDLNKDQLSLRRKLDSIAQITATTPAIPTTQPPSLDDLMFGLCFLRLKGSDTKTEDVSIVAGTFEGSVLTAEEKDLAKRRGEFKVEAVPEVTATNFRPPIVQLYPQINFNDTFRLNERFAVAEDLIPRIPDFSVQQASFNAPPNAVPLIPNLIPNALSGSFFGIDPGSGLALSITTPNLRAAPLLTLTKVLGSSSSGFFQTLSSAQLQFDRLGNINTSIGIGNIVSLGCSCRCKGLNFFKYFDLLGKFASLLGALGLIGLGLGAINLGVLNFICSFLSVLNPLALNFHNGGFSVLSGLLNSIGGIFNGVQGASNAFKDLFDSARRNANISEKILLRCSLKFCGSVLFDKTLGDALSGDLDIKGIVTDGASRVSPDSIRKSLEKTKQQLVQNVTPQGSIKLPGFNLG